MRVWLLLALVACQRNPSKLDDNHFAPTSVVEPPQQGSGSASADTISGTVVETIPASTYTYVRLDRDGHDVWIAGPEMKIAIGAKLGPLQGTLMPQFHSDTLNRTFPEIYFVNTFGQPVPSTHGAAGASGGGPLAGTVVTTMDAGGYTYAQLDSKTWLAGPTMKLTVGTKLAGTSGSLMTGFHSSTLNRTFDQIYFVNSWGQLSGGTTQPTTNAAPATAATEPVEHVAPAPNGKTVAEIIGGRTSLAGKTVDVRGKVVKVTSGVLDRNWLHLRDGSGAAATSDLMVTTKEPAKVGEIVIAHGTVGTNRDLGVGYHYDVLVENATLTR